MKSETDNLSDSQYMRTLKNYQDKHAEEMKRLHKLCERPKENNKISFVQKIKNFFTWGKYG